MGAGEGFTILLNEKIFAVVTVFLNGNAVVQPPQRYNIRVQFDYQLVGGPPNANGAGASRQFPGRISSVFRQCVVRATLIRVTGHQ